MRVATDTYRGFRRSALLRGVVYLCAGGLVAIFASFWVVIGIVAAFVSEPYPLLNAALFVGLGGIVPGIGAGMLVVRGAAWLRRRARMTRLVGVLADRANMGFDELVVALRLSPAAVEDLLIESIRLRIFPREELSTISRAGALPPAAMGQPSYSSLAGGPTAVSSPPQPMPQSGQAYTLQSVHPAANRDARPWAPTTPAAAPVPIPSAHPPAAYPSVPAPAMPLSAASLVQAFVGRLVLNTYQVEAHLGTGGMGAVFRARHVRTGRRYAFKILLPDAHISLDSIRRFEREATSASALGHPGLIAVHDFNRTEEGIAFLVMDLLEGETLLQRLERHGSLPWPAAQRIALEIGDALACAHEAGLMHRDIKPANIFLARAANGAERSVLVDFGLVKPVQESRRSRVTASGVAVGTPLYMSPEQARGEAIDPRSDLYSLAAVLYEMLTGTPVFFDRSLPAVYARLLNEPAPRVSSVVPSASQLGLDDIFVRALAKRPEERPANVRAFMAELARIRMAPSKATVVMG